MLTDVEIPEDEPPVNVISLELARQRAADRDRLRHARLRRPFERPSLVRPPIGPRGDAS